MTGFATRSLTEARRLRDLSNVLPALRVTAIPICEDEGMEVPSITVQVRLDDYLRDVTARAADDSLVSSNEIFDEINFLARTTTDFVGGHNEQITNAVNHLEEIAQNSAEETLIRESAVGLLNSMLIAVERTMNGP